MSASFSSPNILPATSSMNGPSATLDEASNEGNFECKRLNELKKHNQVSEFQALKEFKRKKDEEAAVEKKKEDAKKQKLNAEHRE